MFEHGATDRTPLAEQSRFRPVGHEAEILFVRPITPTLPITTMGRWTRCPRDAMASAIRLEIVPSSTNLRCHLLHDFRGRTIADARAIDGIRVGMPHTGAGEHCNEDGVHFLLPVFTLCAIAGCRPQDSKPGWPAVLVPPEACSLGGAFVENALVLAVRPHQMSFARSTSCACGEYSAFALGYNVDARRGLVCPQKL
jgi:hypothetical protein